MGDDADFWEALTKGGIKPDSATAIVQSHRGMTDADLWERLTKNGATPDAATSMVHARGGQPQDDTGLSLRNVGRSFTQGATFGFGDEMGLTDRAKESAFKAEHPVVDFLGKMAGGVIAPAAAVAAAPALGTTLGGAALLGGAVGALNGAGEADDGNRLSGAVSGGLLGAGGGAAGYGIAKGAGAVASTVLDRMHPERAVARAASKILDPGLAAKLAQIDAIAPGGASIATASAPANGDKVSRMLPMLRAVGADAKAGARAESHLTAQNAALDAARDGIGAKMDALTGDVPVTPEVRSAMLKAKGILGGKAPEMPDPSLTPAANPLGLQQSIPFSFNPTKKTLDVQELRDALSRMRFMERNMQKRGVDAPGMTLKDVGDARADLQRVIYKHSPDFASLDKDYAIASNQVRQTDKAIKTVQRSRANYQANDAYGSTSGSLGGSLPRGAHGVVMATIDRLFTNKAGAADAVANLIAKPGGPEMVQHLLRTIPKPSTMPTRATAAGMSATIPAMRGLLFPSTSP